LDGDAVYEYNRSAVLLSDARELLPAWFPDSKRICKAITVVVCSSPRNTAAREHPTIAGRKTLGVDVCVAEAMVGREEEAGGSSGLRKDDEWLNCGKMGH
jgi:hypothetical protein